MSNKKTYRKYAATTMAAAAAVASVAPVATAAEETKDFTDVNKNHNFYNEIMALTSEGLITGYEDGSFRPQAPIRRVSVANMIHRDLNLDVPKDLDAALGKFVDVKVGDEYDTVIAAVSEAGILTGNSKGEFNAWRDITREQMASVLYRAYDLGQYEADHVNINLKGVDDSHKEAVQTLANLGITQGTALEDFQPLKPITRGQFAAQLHRTLEVINDEVEVPAPEVQSVSAINAKQVKVEFSQPIGTNGTEESSYLVRTVNTGASNEVKAVSKINDNTVVLTLEDEYRVATDITVTVDNVYLAGSIKDKFPKFSAVVNVNDTVAPSITSVSAKTTSTNSAQELTVTLSEPIKQGATFRVNNKTVTATPLTSVIPVAPKTAHDYATTYQITGLDLEVGKSHELEILNAEDYADNSVTSLTQTFAVEQDTAPATGQVTTVQDNKVLVKFDKPVVEASLSNVKFFTYDPSTGGFSTALANTVVKADKLGKEWLFTLTGAASFYGTNKNTEEVLVKVDKGVIDEAGNPVKPFESKVTFTQDVTGPALQNITFEKNSKGEVTKLFFAYDELLTVDANGTLQTNIGGTGDVDVADVNQYFELLDNTTNKGVNFTDVFGAPEAIELASDGTTVVVTVDPTTTPVTSGNYKVTSIEGFVFDDAATPNDSKKVTKDLNIGTAEKVVKADPSVVAGTNDFTVDFDQEVTADSAKNPANYAINGKALPADTKIVVENSKQVTFTLPDGFIAVDEVGAKLTVNNIKPVDTSYKFSPYVGTINVLDNTAPVSNGIILENGEIFITFSEAVENLTATDFETVKVNGLELDSGEFNATTANTPDGKDAVKITVDANVATLAGFTYLYIDVDNSGDFDFDKDIELAKVSGTDAPEAWYSDGAAKTILKAADLNKLNSVEVITADPTTTTDASTLKNELEANVTIKIK